MRFKFWGLIGCMGLYGAVLGAVCAVIVGLREFNPGGWWQGVVISCLVLGIGVNWIALEPPRSQWVLAAAYLTAVAGGVLGCLSSHDTRLGLAGFLLGGWLVGEESRGFPLFLLIAVPLVWTVGGAPLEGLAFTALLLATKALHDLARGKPPQP